MKLIVRLFILFALAVGAFSQYTTASAAQVFMNKGAGANAEFYSVDGCVVSEVFVSGLDNLSKTSPGSPTGSSFVFLAIRQYDACSGDSLVDAEGFAWLDEAALQVSKQQDWATLSATVSAYDYVSESYFDVYVDLTWTATGPLSSSKYHDNFHSPHCNVNSRFTSMLREAQAYGTVSDGSTNFTPDPSWWASIISFKSGDVVAGCE